MPRASWVAPREDQRLHLPQLPPQELAPAVPLPQASRHPLSPGSPPAGLTWWSLASGELCTGSWLGRCLHDACSHACMTHAACRSLGANLCEPLCMFWNLGDVFGADSSPCLNGAYCRVRFY